MERLDITKISARFHQRIKRESRDKS